MTLNPLAFANAAAVLMGGFYLVCRLLAGVAPDLLRTIGQSWFHTLVFPADRVPGLGLGLTIFGFLTAVGLSWLTGYLFVWIYNRISK